VIYGAFPFLRYKKATELPLDLMVIGDPILQRIMVSALIKPVKISGVNYKAAKAFQEFLLSPQAQAMVRAYRVEGSGAQLWWPAARHNNPTVLVDEEPTSTEHGGSGTAVEWAPAAAPESAAHNSPDYSHGVRSDPIHRVKSCAVSHRPHDCGHSNAV